MADQMVAAGQGDALKAMEKNLPMGRVRGPEEFANAVLWLCSDAASYVTGQSISVAVSSYAERDEETLRGAIPCGGAKGSAKERSRPARQRKAG